MIAKLTGLIDTLGDNHVIVDVHGVGYLVYASAKTLAKIGSKGMKTSLLIETIVREDQFSLYGFADATEKEWFSILTGVQGVGAKVGLSILSAVPAEQLAMVIASQDKAALQQADGVGGKLALRLVTELKEKAGKMVMGGAATNLKTISTAEKSRQVVGGGTIPLQNNRTDAISALINLGYGRSDAFSAVANAVQNLGESAAVGELIKESLKELSA